MPDKGPFPEAAFECVPAERRRVLRAMVAAQESPLGWRHYPHSPTDYLTDLWFLWRAATPVFVDEGWWRPNVNSGRVDLHELSDAPADPAGL